MSAMLTQKQMNPNTIENSVKRVIGGFYNSKAPGKMILYRCRFQNAGMSCGALDMGFVNRI